MKVWSIRMPEELFMWLREKTARETLERRKYVSMNALAVEILTMAMRADKKGGDR